MMVDIFEHLSMSAKERNETLNMYCTVCHVACKL